MPLLKPCRLCVRSCGVDRLAGEKGFCGLGDRSPCFKRHISFAEEPELLPSYMVYLSGCNLRCGFCIQRPGSVQTEPAGRARALDPHALADDCRQVLTAGARSINLVGGEPSLHPLLIEELAGELGAGAPLVLNTNMLMSPPLLELLDQWVWLYLADLKFGCNDCAEALAGPLGFDYVGTAQRNLLSAGRPVWVRHLLMPGHVECCLEPVARWVAEHLPQARLHLMTGYLRPRGAGGPAMVGPDEIARAQACLDRLGIPPWPGQGPAGPPETLKALSGRQLGRDLEVEVTLAPDGRVLFQDIPQPLADVAVLLCNKRVGRPSPP